MKEPSSVMDFALDLLGKVGPVSARRMFGGVGLFSDGVMFGLIDDGTIFLKTDEALRSELHEAGSHAWVYVDSKGLGQGSRRRQAIGRCRKRRATIRKRRAPGDAEPWRSQSPPRPPDQGSGPQRERRRTPSSRARVSLLVSVEVAKSTDLAFVESRGPGKLGSPMDPTTARTGPSDAASDLGERRCMTARF
jgi:hypothetical protein